MSVLRSLPDPVFRTLYYGYRASGLRWLRLRLRQLPSQLRRPGQRLRILRSYGAFRRTPALAARYLVAGREYDNFTYALGNVAELADVLGPALGVSPETFSEYVGELEADGELRAGLTARLRERAGRRARVEYGRRLGWYAAVRVTKPRVAIETGIHDGLGSAVLLRALERNAAEGSPGTLISLDIRPGVGWLIDERMRRAHDVRIGDARVLLPEITSELGVDFFLHDSDHEYEHELFELETALSGARPGAVIISDNAHASAAFRTFCAQHDLTPNLYLEQPLHHFYPGAGLGLTRIPAADAGPPYAEGVRATSATKSARQTGGTKRWWAFALRRDPNLPVFAGLGGSGRLKEETVVCDPSPSAAAGGILRGMVRIPLKPFSPGPWSGTGEPLAEAQITAAGCC